VRHFVRTKPTEEGRLEFGRTKPTEEGPPRTPQNEAKAMQRGGRVQLGFLSKHRTTNHQGHLAAKREVDFAPSN
jgi:hypothetical protein